MMEGSGTDDYPHARTLAQLPEKPLLDDILSAKSLLEPDMLSRQVGVPEFRFGS